MLLSPIIPCLFTMFLSPVLAEPVVMKPPAEFILLLDGSNSIYFHFNRLVDIVKKWPDYFKISENDSRVAIIQFGSQARIELPLTGDEESVRNVNITFLGSNTHTGDALKMVQDQVLQDARPDAYKIILILTDGASTDKDVAKTAAGQLREAGVITYVLFAGRQYRDPAVKEHVDNDLAGDSERVFHAKRMSDLTQKLIKELQLQIECLFNEVCQFNGSTYCENAWVRQMVTDQTCSNKPPDRFRRDCSNIIECHEECDTWWPWDEPNCRESAGQTVSVSRLGPMSISMKSVLEQCPKTKNVLCPTESGEMSTTMTSEQGWSISESMSSEDMGTKPGGVMPPAGRPKNKEPKPESSSFPWWAILIVVIVLVMFIVIVIVGAAILSRKKKKRIKVRAGHGTASSAGKSSHHRSIEKKKRAKRKVEDDSSAGKSAGRRSKAHKQKPSKKPKRRSVTKSK